MTTDTAQLRELLAETASPFTHRSRGNAKTADFMEAAPALLDELDRLRAELAEARKEKALIVAWRLSRLRRRTGA